MADGASGAHSTGRYTRYLRDQLTQSSARYTRYSRKELTEYEASHGSRTSQVLAQYEVFAARLREAMPPQAYVYPASTLHCTIASLRSFTHGPLDVGRRVRLRPLLPLTVTYSV